MLQDTIYVSADSVTHHIVFKSISTIRVDIWYLNTDIKSLGLKIKLPVSFTYLLPWNKLCSWCIDGFFKARYTDKEIWEQKVYDHDMNAFATLSEIN